MIGALLGLLGACLIGGADAIARRTSQAIAIPSLVFLVLFLSTPPVAFIIGVARAGAGEAALWSPEIWPADGVRIAVASGVFNAVALALLFAGLSRGPVALVSPTIASSTVLLVALNAAAGAPISIAQIAAVFVVFFGVAMLSRPETDSETGAESPARLRVTLAISLAAAIAVALRMYWAQDAAEALGSVETLLLTRLVAAMVAAPVAAYAIVAALRGGGGPTPWPSGALWLLVCAQAALEAAALGAFLWGGSADGGDRIGAAIGFSAFAAATPLFAWAAYGEAVSARRWLWIGVVIAGVALAAAGAPA